MILELFYVFSTSTMKVSIDFGGSTIDIVCWKGKRPLKICSFERFSDFASKGLKGLPDVMEAMKIQSGDVEKIYVTGGKSRFFPAKMERVPVIKVAEIEAIGRGGFFLLQQSRLAERFKKAARFLVVSMGTGTCMVQVRQGKHGAAWFEHIGGTGVGGGTFLGLAKSLLKETDLGRLRKMFRRGDRSKVDLSVGDIVGSGIGVVPAEATASNLARLARVVDFSKNDVAAGIVNLIGQTIGITAAFAARAHGCDFVLLTGKLTRIEQITDVVKETGRMYKIQMFVPPNADYVSSLGAALRP